MLNPDTRELGRQLGDELVSNAAPGYPRTTARKATIRSKNFREIHNPSSPSAICLSIRSRHMRVHCTASHLLEYDNRAALNTSSRKSSLSCSFHRDTHAYSLQATSDASNTISDAISYQTARPDSPADRDIMPPDPWLSRISPPARDSEGPPQPPQVYECFTSRPVICILDCNNVQHDRGLSIFSSYSPAVPLILPKMLLPS